MKSIENRLKESYIVGCIKYDQTYQFYLMPVAWWILDYATYDPTILQKDKYNFRNGIYVVYDDKIQEYLNSIVEDKISLSEMKYINQNFPEEYSRITFFIDFDMKEYINGFFDIELEEYLPTEIWKGKSDWYPINFLPHELIKNAT